MLALLAVGRETPLAAEQLVRRIWDDAPPDSAVQMVRNQIRALRLLIGRTALESDLPGYRLADRDVEIDAEVFRALVQQGRRQLADNRILEAVHTVQRGLYLWRGPEALSGVRDIPSLEIEAVDLEDLRFQAEEAIVEGYLALDRPGDALPLLRVMTAAHPTREMPWLQLMAAETLIGRRIEASVETFRRAQHHLVESTGLDAPMLASMHTALLRGAEGPELVALIRRRPREWHRS
ncbi:AfsR/SARP family transcriptional regulator [Actinoplanes sp. NEAU-A12]|uniref:AfsR/SARP family transcriptional regulator n=1 Tax=Actinoplanes sandaracinus TaxID=3045177 RepID=A0ABT6WI76_9ACTN|nr:AfsR/SARP family transcriptional regulator [Actinoplanes sandaracinus]MDI6099435.1 AfsR/SARP family transcriptional regulator [Actinoplanes sandaracinus]